MLTENLRSRNLAGTVAAPSAVGFLSMCHRLIGSLTDVRSVLLPGKILKLQQTLHHFRIRDFFFLLEFSLMPNMSQFCEITGFYQNI